MTIDLSLDRVKTLLVHLHSYTRPTLHIAGTNGKGSVSALLTSILLSAGPPLLVGRFNSPHLVSIYDCITIDNSPVSSSLYHAVRADVESADKEHQTGLTNFEILTLVALQIFERTRVDIVVLEVGMGGRLDATNVVSDETIAVSALTAVDLDHQTYLGDTVFQIAQEKAGIARRGRPFVFGKQKHSGVKEAVKEVLARLRSETLVEAVNVRTREWNETIDGIRPPPFSLSPPFQQPAAQPVSADLPCFSETVDALLPLYGTHQLDNLGTSLTIVNELLDSPSLQEISNSLRLKDRLTANSVARGIQTVRWPGRLSFHTLSLESLGEDTAEPLIVLVDGAHNAASAETLGDYITHLLGLCLCGATRSIEITYIISLSHSPPKTPLETLSRILPPKLPSHLVIPCNVTTRVILLPFTPPDGMPWIKPVPPEDIALVAKSLIPDLEVHIKDDLGNALKLASSLRRFPNLSQGMAVLAGSLYLVADFYRILRSP